MAITLSWMRPDAPYMTIVTVGLLSIDVDAMACWREGSLVIETGKSEQELAVALLAAPLPDPDAIPWPAGAGQSLASALASYGDPLAGFGALCQAVAGTTEELLLRAVATDQARRASAGPPARSRLLIGAKADLSPFRWRPRGDVRSIDTELRFGPAFVGSGSGPCMGLAPEVHTFGGTVGRDASTIGAASQLLALLIRHGLLALPPTGGPGRGARGACGPLLDSERHLSWPVWTFPLDCAGLQTLFAWEAVHAPEPDATLLLARGVEAVYRSVPVPLSDTVSVFRWGRRVV